MKQKIKLLADLSSILEDEEVLSLLRSKSNGDKVVEIFKAALEVEIENIFGNKIAEITSPVEILVNKINTANDMLDKVLAKTTTPQAIATPPVDKPVIRQASTEPSQQSVSRTLDIPAPASGAAGYPSQFQGELSRRGRVEFS